MNITAQQTEFLSWKVVPARLDATQAAWFLGFEPHEIPMLVATGLLKPLGHPARNSTKFFATETLEQYAATRNGSPAPVIQSPAIGGNATPASNRLAGARNPQGI